MDFRKIALSFAIGTSTLLSSFAVLTPITYADPPTGGGDPPNCDDEIAAYFAAWGDLVTAQTAYEAAKKTSRDAYDAMKSANDLLKLYKALPNDNKNHTPPRDEYYPYSQAEYFTRLLAAEAGYKSAKTTYDDSIESEIIKRKIAFHFAKLFVASREALMLCLNGF